MENGLEIWKKYVSNTWHKGVISYGSQTIYSSSPTWDKFESSVISYGSKTSETFASPKECLRVVGLRYNRDTEEKAW